VSERARVNIAQAAKLAGVSRLTMYYWIRDGKVDAVTTETGVRIYVDSIPVRTTQPQEARA